jgi:acyl carrier protein
MKTDAIASQVRDFVVANFLFGQQSQPLENEASFLDNGIVDSTGVLELVAFIEQEFGVTVDDRELVPANLDSIAAVTRFVGRKLESNAAVSNR